MGTPNEMTRDNYIEANIDKLLYQWSNVAIFTSAFVVLALGCLDYFVTQVNFNSFLIYRIVVSAILIIFYYLNRRKINRAYQIINTVVCAIVISIMIELMILKFGGHQSPYFVGIILTIIYILGFIPFPMKINLLMAPLIYSIYLIPILIFDIITNNPFFISINVLLLTIIFFVLIWKFFSMKGLRNELGLQYDLDQEKNKIEIYSTELEDIVDERTKKLKESELKLKKSESMLRSLFEYATDGIMILDQEGKILEVNQKVCEIYGFDKNEIVNTSINFHAVDGFLSKERIDRLLKGESLLFETQHFRKDGKKVSLEITANAIEVEGKVLIQAFVRDITDKKRLQEQLLQSQKMESIGSLAGGIAHNFNNLLTSILGNAELLEEYRHIDNKLAKRTKNIENSAKKAGVLVSKLLSFVHQDTHEITPLNLNVMIREALLFEGVLGKKIKLVTDLSKNLPTVEGDRNQLEQVIMNLIVNARDAMPDGGLITITSSMVDVGKDTLETPYIRSGHYVMVSVSDTGRGIPENIINRVFEPFFTTKERGKGTGLGLATVYGIVKDHKGHVTVRSEVDKGSTFYVYLPVSGKPVPEITEPQPVYLYGKGNILVVDDEEDVLHYIKDSLETHGYQAITTTDPLEAIDLFKELVDEVDLVITDIIMPQMEGQELIMHLRQIKNDIKIIAISGYSDVPISKEKIMIDAFIKKPFESSHFLSTVRHILDREQTVDTQAATGMSIWNVD